MQQWRRWHEADFKFCQGLSARFAQVRCHPSPHHRCGTPHWASPEVLRGEALGPAAAVRPQTSECFEEEGAADVQYVLLPHYVAQDIYSFGVPGLSSFSEVQERVRIEQAGRVLLFMVGAQTG